MRLFCLRTFKVSVGIFIQNPLTTLLPLFQRSFKLPYGLSLCGIEASTVVIRTLVQSGLISIGWESIWV